MVGGGEERTVTVERSEASANVTGLLPGTDYMFGVVAVSEFRGVLAPSPPSNNVTDTTETTGNFTTFRMLYHDRLPETVLVYDI